MVCNTKEIFVDESCCMWHCNNELDTLWSSWYDEIKGDVLLIAEANVLPIVEVIFKQFFVTLFKDFELETLWTNNETR